jgi:release factor glutamine methyltransferase
MVKLFELIKYGKEKLNNSNTPQLDAEVILSHILKVDRIYLYSNREKVFDEEIENYFKSLINRRLKGEPIAYITGTKEFMGLDFKVKPGVLIPRGDTEILVEEVVDRVGKQKQLVIVDIGCGSGAISISLAKNINSARVYALDIMEIPLEVTAENSVINCVDDRLIILKSDLLEALGRDLLNTIDVIVSNPPYIEEEVIETLMTDVKDYEPISALAGGKDGLDFYKRITNQAVEFLKKGGLLAYEIGYNQGEGVCKILKANGFQRVECIKDLGGNDRVVLGYLEY